MGLFVNALLLMIGSVSGVLGVSFYIRNRNYTKNISAYLLGMGVFSAMWCIAYGFIGITENFYTCEVLRRIGIAGVNGFLIAEVYLISEISGVGKKVKYTLRHTSILTGLIDYFNFSKGGVDTFFRKGSWTTWYATEGYDLERNIHTVFIALMFLTLFSLGMRWKQRNNVRRLNSFINVCFIANFLLIFFCIPDTFLPTIGYDSISTSGIGSFICNAVIYYGAVRLNSFDIRMGNIAERFLDFIEAGIVVFDTDKKGVIINRYAKRLLRNVPSEEYKLSDLFDTKDVDVDGMFDEALSDVYQTRLYGCDRKSAYSVRLNALKDNYDEPFCYLFVFVDITDEMNMVEKLEVASQAKTRFLAQMSHEIRTPINAVLGMNEMILRESNESGIIEYAENIDSAGNTLLSIINSILDFSKIEDGKMEIVPVEYDTASLMNNIVNSVSQRAEEKGLRFEVSIDSSLPCTLNGDDVRICQIIMNLLTNAVKYTEHGTVKLIVKYVGKADKTAKIFVCVKDTGIGIKKEDIKKLSVSFERLDEVKNHNIEGTGLGISIVENLLRLMGSRLDIKSEYRKGSEFFFTVEQGIIDETPIGDFEQRINDSRSRRDDTDFISAPNAKVLLVDDNQMNLMVGKHLLKLCDIVPDLATSGAETIERMGTEKYDIVLLDYMMPHMDGIETLHILREKNLLSDGTAVIALTANAVVGAKETFLKEGFDDYLSKPIEIKEMVSVLKRNLKGLNVEEVKETKKPKSANVKSIEKNSFPRIEGIDWNLALKNAPSHEMISDFLKTFCDASEEDIIELDKYENGVRSNDPEAISLYKVKVHSLKNCAAVIGAKELSEEARTLEFAAKDKDTELILELHGDFVQHYSDMAKTIRKDVLKESGPEKKLMSREALLQNLSVTEEALEAFDTETLNTISFSLKNYSFEDEKTAEMITALRHAIRDFDIDKIKIVIESLKTKASE